MGAGFWKKMAVFAGSFVAVWLAARYLLPVALPFLLGLFLAMAAEPVVEFGVKKLSLPRSLSVGIGVSLTIILLLGLLFLTVSLVIKELGELVKNLPDMENTAKEGIETLKTWAVRMADRTPKGIRPMVNSGVQQIFRGDASVASRATEKALETAESVLSKIPNSALGLGVTVLSAFMISRRLPDIRKYLEGFAENTLGGKVLPAIKTARKVVGKWLLAQLKLSGITFSIVTLGLLLLKIPYAPLLALGVAFVDALPMLGTGIVLLPWAAVNLLQGNPLLAAGLAVIYGVAVTARTVAEPRLVGDQLGLDPFLTLVFLYGGFRFWGIPGLLLTPILAGVVRCVLEELYRQKRQKYS